MAQQQGGGFNPAVPHVYNPIPHQRAIPPPDVQPFNYRGDGAPMAAGAAVNHWRQHPFGQFHSPPSVGRRRGSLLPMRVRIEAAAAGDGSDEEDEGGDVLLRRGRRFSDENNPDIAGPARVDARQFPVPQQPANGGVGILGPPPRPLFHHHAQPPRPLFHHHAQPPMQRAAWHTAPQPPQRFVPPQHRFINPGFFNQAFHGHLPLERPAVRAALPPDPRVQRQETPPRPVGPVADAMQIDAPPNRLNVEANFEILAMGPPRQQPIEMENGFPNNRMPMQQAAGFVAQQARGGNGNFDENLAQLVEMFPKVDPDFLTNQLKRMGGSVEFTLEWLLAQKSSDLPKLQSRGQNEPQKLSEAAGSSAASKRPAESPRSAHAMPATKKMEASRACGVEEIVSRLPDLKHFSSWAEFDKADFYSSDYWKNLSGEDKQADTAEYEHEAEAELFRNFPQISIPNLRDAFNKFGGCYGITLRYLSDGIAQMLRIKGADVKLSDFAKQVLTIDIPTAHTQLKLKVLLKPRRSGSQVRAANPLFAKELEWLEFKPLRDAEKIANGEDECAKPTEALIECEICANEYPIEDMRSCSDGHLFCKICLEMYAKEAIYGQGKKDLKCMLENCDQPFTRTTLLATLSPTRMEKLDERNFEEDLNLAGMEGLIRCKKCNFPVVLADDPQHNKVFSCPNCKMETCRLCGCDWNDEHFGKPCKEIEADEVTRARKEVEERLALAVIRHCPRCNKPMIKDEGCNKLTCPCGATLCYLCRTPHIDYKHFCQHPLEPGKACDKCKQCMLWEKPELKDAKVLQELEQRGKEEIAEAANLAKQWMQPGTSKATAAQDNSNADGGSASNDQNNPIVATFAGIRRGFLLFNK